MLSTDFRSGKDQWRERHSHVPDPWTEYIGPIKYYAPNRSANYNHQLKGLASISPINKPFPWYVFFLSRFDAALIASITQTGLAWGIMVIMVIGGPTITLSNGTKMPQVGLGTWQSKPEEVKAAVKTAVEAGYRLIDTATCYENENAIGDAIKELIQEGKVTREELFITTKLWLTHLHPDDTETGIRQSLDRLQLDYVDLYLAHFPTCFNHDMTEQNPSVTVQDIWRGLEGVYKKGLTKAVGVSNWNGEQIERVLKTASVPIHNLQVELYLYWPQHELHEVCKKHNISLTSYGSLGSPGRVNFSLPSGAKLVWASAPNPFEDENVKNLAKKYTKTPAQNTEDIVASSVLVRIILNDLCPSDDVEEINDFANIVVSVIPECIRSEKIDH
ncbi:oxidoreductase, aldo/keto reductase family protein [Teladorsagia circumcincta]|uniref:Oxidoreductase, aldo/keto reductase family protein n=1 Tax=Teladorsagia circumcincta TaxID=45464 RepID=A0A2G9U8G2_TELCI|nr:oxidoreductase, aldo/keto reductase family protein [Teladorsagia circumcincta]